MEILSTSSELLTDLHSTLNGAWEGWRIPLVRTVKVPTVVKRMLFFVPFVLKWPKVLNTLVSKFANVYLFEKSGLKRGIFWYEIGRSEPGVTQPLKLPRGIPPGGEGG